MEYGESTDVGKVVGGPYEIFAGRDASRGLAKQSFDADMLSDLSGPIDTLEDLTKADWENLKDWEGESCPWELGWGLMYGVVQVILITSIFSAGESSSFIRVPRAATDEVR